MIYSWRKRKSLESKLIAAELSKMMMGRPKAQQSTTSDELFAMMGVTPRGN